MKAPDRIYINGFSAFATEPVKNGIEYIRKDALLELIKEESSFWDDGEMIFRALVDKLNEM